MKILHINTTDNKGGAAVAVRRIHCQLKLNGINTKVLVQGKFSSFDDVFSTHTSEKLSSILAKAKGFAERKCLDIVHSNRYKGADFFSQIIPINIQRHIAYYNPDIVHLHWISAGFLSVESIKSIKKPIVWTLHDMWPFTGGCHYSAGCTRFQTKCGHCPQLNSNFQYDISHWTWGRKRKSWNTSQIVAVSPSKWLAEEALKSSLFQSREIHTIPNGLDLSIYKNQNSDAAKNRLGFNLNKYTILMFSSGVGNNLRKGTHLLEPIILKLFNHLVHEDIEIVVIGNNVLSKDISDLVTVHNLEYVSTEKDMAVVYCASSVFILPTLEDNFPNTVAESMSCGTPCVSFNVGGLSDMITHTIDGYLAAPSDLDDFAYGIFTILQSKERYLNFRRASRQKAELLFNVQDQATRYIKLYESILMNSYGN